MFGSPVAIQKSASHVLAGLQSSVWSGQTVGFGRVEESAMQRCFGDFISSAASHLNRLLRKVRGANQDNRLRTHELPFRSVQESAVRAIERVLPADGLLLIRSKRDMNQINIIS